MKEMDYFCGQSVLPLNEICRKFGIINQMRMKKYGFLMAMASVLGACTPDSGIDLAVINPAGGSAIIQMASTPAAPLLEKLGSAYVYVLDADGREIPSQITAAGDLIFPVEIGTGATAGYTVLPSDTAHVYKTVTCGRPYPERADDVAWENERVGFRVYGPSTQRKGERAFGYDIFFKHFNEEPVLPVLYKDETDPAVWARVDSLRAIDPKLAQDYIDSFSYHIDHGLGMDCYAVGPTMGDGVAAFIDNDSILFAWCYDTVEVLDNGPLRFTARFDFAPRIVGADTAVVEHRIVSLDRGAYLNRQHTWFDGLGASRRIGAGMPLRQGARMASGADYAAVTDSTQGPDNGMALLGVVMPGAEASALVQNHNVVFKELAPSDTLTHYWGFAWDRENFGTLDDWGTYLGEVSKAIANPVKVTVK